MENVSHFAHSFSKKPHTTHSTYDDVFAGAHSFGATSLAPRLQDYSEIFGGFHASRGRSSAIPLLDLPAVNGDFDFGGVSTSDYSEVFGGFHGVEFACSFEELVNAAEGGYDSSDEAWSPAHSGSLSEDTDPSAFSERSHSTTIGDMPNSFNGIKHFNLSYHTAHQRSDGDITTGMDNITHLHAIPGYTCIVEEKVASENHKDEERPHQGTNDTNYKEDFVVGVTEDKTCSKNVSLTMNNEFSQMRGRSLNPWQTRSKSGPILNEPLLTVSDVSLRTKPSHLPPPSRRPPVLAVGRGGESGVTRPKPRTSRSMSIASLEDALCGTENLRNSENFTDFRDEGLQTSENLQMKMENDMECLSSHIDGREECTSMPFDLLNNTVDHAFQWSQAEDLEKIREVVSDEERKRLIKSREVVFDGIYGEIEINSRERSRKYKPRKDHTSYLGSSKSEEIVSWREAAEYFEVETDFYRKDYKQSQEDTIGNKDIDSIDNSKLEKMAPERGTKQDKLNEGELPVKCVPGDGRSRKTSRSVFQIEDQKGTQVIGTIDAPKTTKEEQFVMHEEIKKVLYTGKSMETRDEDGSQHENVTDTDLYKEGGSERAVKKFSNANTKKESEMVSEEVFEIDHLMKRNNESEQTIVEDKTADRQDQEEREKQQNELLGRPQSKEIQKGAHVRIGPKTSESIEQNGNDSSFHRMCTRVDVHHAHEQYKKDRELSLTREAENNLVEDCHKLEVEMGLQRSFKEDKFGTEKETCQKEHEEHLGADPGSNVYEIRSKEALENNRSRTSSTEDLYEEGTQKKSMEASENKGEFTGLDGTLSQNAKMDELKKNVTKEEFDSSKTSPLEINEKPMHEVRGIDDVSQKAKMDELKKKVTKEEFDSSKTSPLEINEKPTHEVRGIDNVSHPVKGRHNMDNKNLGLSRKVNSREIAVNTSEQIYPFSSTASGNVSEKTFNNVATILSHVVSLDQEVKVPFAEVQRAECITGLQVTVGDGILMEKLRKPQLASEWVDHAKNISDALQTVLVDIGDMQDDYEYEAEASQGKATKMNNMSRILLPEEPKIEKCLRNDGELKHESFMSTKEERERQMQREKESIAKTQKAGRLKGRELHDEHLKRVEEEREREREREKDRTAVENTIREARERSYVDARERAALERATSEARQRAMAEARERLEKASAEAREARLKAERAAVERATTEARQRAFEKAMSAKCNSETNVRVDRADKFPSKEMKLNGRTYDSCNTQMQNRQSYTNYSAQVGVEGESPQRCKARMERYQRTTERAAKALAEKNMRDLVAQREQEERSRLAEILDADVKRWSSGKEGNLRALLSTLQYILGPDSGWQPIPLTQVITSAAVKRAYRKATLCVHPDKLQQRGANTQQKYICEKVFDLLKEAWNKFNSEER